MNVWAVYPSADPVKGEACSIRWQERGFHTLVWQDPGKARVDADAVVTSTFSGYYRAINYLAWTSFHIYHADCVVCIGDDMLPDPSIMADQFAERYFSKLPNGDGVMQATGDPQGIDDSGRSAAARICGSPAFGREWCERAYEGRGPFWNGYGSYYGDEDLYEVAKDLGKLHQEPEITIFHNHWSFGHQDQADYQKRNSDNHWMQDKALFFSRKQAGFPGSALR